MSYLSNQVQQGFDEAFRLTRELAGGETQAEVTLVFGSKTIPAVPVSIEDGRDMLPAGYQFEFDASCVVRIEDFRTLGVSFESKVTLDGQPLRLKRWLRTHPLMTLYFSAER